MEKIRSVPENFIVTYSYFCFNKSQTPLLIYYYPLLYATSGTVSRSVDDTLRI